MAAHMPDLRISEQSESRFVMTALMQEDLDEYKKPFYY